MGEGEGESIAFDRAADIYDETRAISPEAMERNLRLLSSELRDRGRVLEVGVGTGLLALPLHGAGLELVGVDLSRPMLAKLLAKVGDRPPFPIVMGDGTRMPFADAAFGAAYLRWVLHLVQDWRGVLAEVVRVVRPGGVFLANLGAYGGPREEIRTRFAELSGMSVEPVGLGWGDFDPLDAAMGAYGASARELPPVREGSDEPLAAFLQGIEAGRYSWTWGVPETIRLLTVAELRGWAEERFGGLEERRPFEHATRWRAYDLA